jgi:hypothetical protein
MKRNGPTIRLTTEDALRNKQYTKWSLPSTVTNLNNTSTNAYPVAGQPLFTTTNQPTKRLRITNPKQEEDISSTAEQRSVYENPAAGSELKTAPDWNGNETTPSQPWGSTPGPYDNIASSIPPTPPQYSTFSAAQNAALSPLSLAHPKWGLRQDVVMGFKACGVEKMYQWQDECLSLPGVLEGTKNVVYTAPTSAGKSLVADVLAIKKSLKERKKIIIVLPYVAIVQEKTRFLKKCLGNIMAEVPRRHPQQQKWRQLNIVGYHSGAKSRIGWKELDIAICTIEKVGMQYWESGVWQRCCCADKVWMVGARQMHWLMWRWRTVQLMISGWLSLMNCICLMMITAVLYWSSLPQNFCALTSLYRLWPCLPH